MDSYWSFFFLPVVNPATAGLKEGEERPGEASFSGSRSVWRHRVFKKPRQFVKPESFYTELLQPFSLYHNSGGRARGSRSLALAVLGTVTNGPPSIGVTFVKATSGISLGSPSSGNSFRNGKNG